MRGRAFSSGKAFTFVTPAEQYHIDKIEGIIRMKIPEKSIPQSVKIEETLFIEKQEMDREIDRLRKKENPDFQGAFHEKKKAKKSPKKR